MPRKKNYREDVVVTKAMHTFWSGGYERTSVRKLEEEMGINQFSMYSSFGNKQKLFIEVLKAYKGHVKDSFLKGLLVSEGRLDDIRRFFLDFGLSICSGENANGCLMVNTGMEVGQKDPEIARQLVLYFEFIKNTFRQVLEKAKTNGELSASFESEKHSEFLLGSLQGLSLYAKFREDTEIVDYVDTVMKTLR